MADPAAGVRIEEVTSTSPELVVAVGQLVGQLSSRAQPPSAAHLLALVDSTASRLLLARERDGRVVGMATLALLPIPTGVRAWIEDVVVDQAARGRGIGALLTREAIRLAQAGGAPTVDLTSRPSRAAANRLYTSLGFELRETNVYRHENRRGT
jgi:ribosomal protein S18 acetylase RimI-like enzyme